MWHRLPPTPVGIKPSMPCWNCRIRNTAHAKSSLIVPDKPGNAGGMNLYSHATIVWIQTDGLGSTLSTPAGSPDGARSVPKSGIGSAQYVKKMGGGQSSWTTRKYSLFRVYRYLQGSPLSASCGDSHRANGLAVDSVGQARLCRSVRGILPYVLPSLVSPRALMP